MAAGQKQPAYGSKGRGPGLVLGSGGVRGLAHIGAIRFLSRVGVSPSLVAGTSMGAVVGAALATGRLDALKERINGISPIKAASCFWDFANFLHGGLVKGGRIKEFISEIIPDAAIEDLPVPFAAMATDLDSGEAVAIRSGSLIDAVRASISIPCLFSPVRIGGRLLVDGGISSPVPVGVARAMGAGTVIAVNVNNSKPCPRRLSADSPERGAALLERVGGQIQSGESVLSVLLKTTRIVEDRIVRDELARNEPDLLIEPAVGDIGTLDFFRMGDAILAGEEEARLVWEEEKKYQSARRFSLP